MTVETTSFLSTAKIASSNGQEKSAKILNSHKNVIIILLIAILLIFCISASVLQIWIYHRMNGMQEEIDKLNLNIREMKNNELVDRELLNEINEFNRKYSTTSNQNDVKDHIDLDERNNLADEKTKFDDLGDDEDDDDDYGMDNSDETDDESFNGYHSGYGDDYDGEDDYDSTEDELNDAPPKSEDENNIYKDMEKHSRKARSIAGTTQQGVPIIDEPYISKRRNRTNSKPLNNNDANVPKLKLTWNGQSRNGLRREEYHERNRQHHNTRHHHPHSHHQHSSSHKFAFAAAPLHHTFESFNEKFNDTASTDHTPSNPIQTRQSRVMHFEDKTKAFRQVVRKEQLAKLQEQRMAPEHFIHNAAATARRPMRKNLELRNGKRKQFITAVHFDGDSSKLAEARHHSYRGNGKVELNRNEYMHWKAADWVNSHGMSKYFDMDSSGTLTVNDHGLFLIYAQVLYSDNHDLNGYVIEHNGNVHYQCTTMTHTGTNSDPKTNSCYTSGLIHLRNGDKIRLRDIGNHRYVLMDKSKSYFGLIKINLVPAVSSTESTEVDRYGSRSVVK